MFYRTNYPLGRAAIALPVFVIVLALVRAAMVFGFFWIRHDAAERADGTYSIFHLDFDLAAGVLAADDYPASNQIAPHKLDSKSAARTKDRE